MRPVVLYHSTPWATLVFRTYEMIFGCRQITHRKQAHPHKSDPYGLLVTNYDHLDFEKSLKACENPKNTQS